MNVTRTITVERYRGEPARRGVIELQIDIEALARVLAEKAFWNSSKKSRLCAGAIVARTHSVAQVADCTLPARNELERESGRRTGE